MGQIQIEGGTFTYPIDVCCGCLLSFPPDADAMGGNGHDCDAAAAMTTTVLCQPGQDDLTDCRVCSGSSLLCQPPDFGAGCLL
jgi:hypothetical protein